MAPLAFVVLAAALSGGVIRLVERTARPPLLAGPSADPATRSPLMLDGEFLWHRVIDLEPPQDDTRWSVEGSGTVDVGAVLRTSFLDDHIHALDRELASWIGGDGAGESRESLDDPDIAPRSDGRTQIPEPGSGVMLATGMALLRTRMGRIPR
jgi:hypothetical protein